MDDVDFAAADKEDLNRIEKLSNILEEIKFFNIQQEEVQYSSQDQASEDFSHQKPEDIPIYPTGIQFFNEENIGCLFTSETLKLPSFLPEKIDIWNPILLGNKEELLKLCHLPAHRTDMITYLFHLSFATDDSILLHMTLRKIFYLTDSVSRSYLSSFIDVFLEDLTNLGADMNCLEELDVYHSHPPSAASTSVTNYNLDCTLKHIFDVLVHLLKIESIVGEKDSPFPSSQLNKLLIILMMVAADPLLINSDIQWNISSCIRIILELYSQEGFVYQESVMNVVERIGIYWDNKMTDARFPHDTVCHVCADLLPVTPRGKTLRAPLAYYSMMCCLDLQDTDLLYDVTLSTLLNFCNSHIKEMRRLNCFTLGSFVLLLDCCVQGPIEDQPEKECLSWLIDIISSVADLKQKENAKEPSDFCLGAIARTATHKWERLLKKKKEKLKQTRIMDFMSQENEDSFSLGPQ